MENQTDEDYKGPVLFEECQIQRSLGFLFVCLIASGGLIQIGLINAIATSPFHRRNVCYQSILVIGVFNLIQLISQAFLSSNLLACTNLGEFFNVIGGSLNNVSYYVIEPYSLVLAINRLIIIVIRKQQLDEIANVVHKWINVTLWFVGIPPIVAAFHPTCHILYRTYSYSREKECIYDDLINGMFNMAYRFMLATFFVYLLLVFGLAYQRAKMNETRRKLMDKTEWRILLTAFSEFWSVFIVMVLRTSYFIKFISDTGPGRIFYRFVLIFSAFLNALLTIALNKPLRNRIYDQWFVGSRCKRTSVITLSSNAGDFEHSDKTRRRSTFKSTQI